MTSYINMTSSVTTPKIGTVPITVSNVQTISLPFVNEGGKKVKVLLCWYCKELTFSPESFSVTLSKIVGWHRDDYTVIITAQFCCKDHFLLFVKENLTKIIAINEIITL